MKRWARIAVTLAALAVLALPSAGCATLGALGIGIQPLRFSTDRDRPAELRLGSGGGIGGLGGLPTSAVLTMWARVENPNPIGLTLSTIDGTVFLDDSRAASVDLPLGLPLEAQMEELVPIEVSIRLSDIPRLGGTILRALEGDSVPYRLEGRFSVQAGQLGSPTFGPMTLLSGEVRPRRR
jgi:hypothetical protein